MEFFSSVEFYIMAFVANFAIVGFLMKPAYKGSAQTYFARGELKESDSSPEVGIEYTLDGELIITRYGVFTDTLNCQFNYSIKVIGNDITVSEKKVIDSFYEVRPCTVDITMKTKAIRPGRYHIKIETEWSDQWAAGSIRVSEPFKKTMDLRQ